MCRVWAGRKRGRNPACPSPQPAFRNYVREKLGAPLAKPAGFAAKRTDEQTAKFLEATLGETQGVLGAEVGGVRALRRLGYGFVWSVCADWFSRLDRLGCIERFFAGGG